MAEESEVLMEVEAVQAVYGDDCLVLDPFPPHIHVHIMPRTADVSSQQFVEAVIGIRTSPQYPKKPPHIDIIESKGLDEQRQRHLITTVQDKASELSSSLMLVALCEEAVEKLTAMNHPDGNCPLCLFPLVLEDEQSETLPFMKLMSCFHCFHSECIMRWWNWIQEEKQSNTSSSSTTTLRPTEDVENQSGMYGVMEESMGSCPVCRKVFHSKDFEHVLDLVGTHSSQSISSGMEVVDDDQELLQSDAQNIRREKFEAILKLQQENNGLIQPKKNLVVLPGMFLPQAVTSVTQMLDKEATERQERGPTVPMETSSGAPSTRLSTNQVRNSGRRKHRVQNSRNRASRWIRKENSAEN